MDEGKTLYICDREKCENCSEECEHTTDINHALHFSKNAETGKHIEDGGSLRDGYHIVALVKFDVPKEFRLGDCKACPLSKTSITDNKKEYKCILGAAKGCCPVFIDEWEQEERVKVIDYFNKEYLRKKSALEERVIKATVEAYYGKWRVR